MAERRRRPERLRESSRRSSDSWIGRLILFGYTWALIHHMLGGIRHLIWDTGHGLGPNEREWLAAANLIGSIAITVILWIVGLLPMGARNEPSSSISARRWRACAASARRSPAPALSGISA